jgi:hypothetical protein
LKVRLMSGFEGWHGVVCGLFGAHARHPFGVALGLGCKRRLEDAVDQAVLEVVRTAVVFDRPDMAKRSLDRSAFDTLKDPSPRDHDLLAFDPASARVIEPLFDADQPITRQASVNVSVHEVRPRWERESLSVLRDVPLKAVYVSAPSAQEAFFGHLRPERLNFSRLSAFSGRSVSWSDVQKYPHMFG